MTKKELINSIISVAMCGGFPLTPEQITVLNSLTVKRIKAGQTLLCTGLADVVCDSTLSDYEVILAQHTVSKARRSSL